MLELTIENMSISTDSKANTPLVPQDGEEFYNTRLKATLEPKHPGEFVAIEPTSGRYFLGPTATAALVAAKDAMPQGQFFLTRIGQSTAHRIGGHGSANLVRRYN